MALRHYAAMRPILLYDRRTLTTSIRMQGLFCDFNYLRTYSKC